MRQPEDYLVRPLARCAILLKQTRRTGGAGAIEAVLRDYLAAAGAE